LPILVALQVAQSLKVVQLVAVAAGQEALLVTFPSSAIAEHFVVLAFHEQYPPSESGMRRLVHRLQSVTCEHWVKVVAGVTGVGVQSLEQVAWLSLYLSLSASGSTHLLSEALGHQ
jgi:hypothetical protein